jgi:hypothetical protein
MLAGGLSRWGHGYSPAPAATSRNGAVWERLVHLAVEQRGCLLGVVPDTLVVLLAPLVVETGESPCFEEVADQRVALVGP